jgi:mitogen-activated protein kinase 1/3
LSNKWLDILPSLQAIDVWAVGCILAELLTGRPLFPGRDYGHQLDLILDVIGTPTLDEFYAITSRRSRDYIRALPIRKRRPFTALFPHASAEAIDFLSKTLTFDPKKRITAEEALEHPYLSSYVSLRMTNLLKTLLIPCLL